MEITINELYFRNFDEANRYLRIEPLHRIKNGWCDQRNGETPAASILRKEQIKRDLMCPMQLTTHTVDSN